MADNTHPDAVTRRTLLAGSAASVAVGLRTAAAQATVSPALACVERGRAAFYKYTAADNALAREALLEAISADPLCARAWSLLAATYRQDWSFAWRPEPDLLAGEALEAAQRAVALAREEPDPQPSLGAALVQLAYVLSYLRRHAEARVVADELMSRCPDYADGWAVAAQVIIYAGEPREGLRRMVRAQALRPQYPTHYAYHVGLGHYVVGFLEEAPAHYPVAEQHLRESLRLNTTFRPALIYLAVVLWDQGRRDQASAVMADLRRLGRLQAAPDPARFRQYCWDRNPHASAALTTHLTEVWMAAEAALVSAV